MTRVRLCILAVFIALGSCGCSGIENQQSQFSDAQAIFELRRSLDCSALPERLDGYPMLPLERQTLQFAWARTQESLAKLMPNKGAIDHQNWLLNAVVPVVQSCESYRTEGFAKYENVAKLDSNRGDGTSPFADTAEVLIDILSGHYSSQRARHLPRPKGLPLLHRLHPARELEAIKVLADINRRMSSSGGGVLRNSQHLLYIRTLLNQDQLAALSKETDDMKLLSYVTLTKDAVRMIPGLEQLPSGVDVGHYVQLPQGHAFQSGLRELIRRSSEYLASSSSPEKTPSNFSYAREASSLARLCVVLHPFVDGNGRSCRLWSIYLNQLASLPHSHHWIGSGFLLDEKQWIELESQGREHAVSSQVNFFGLAD